jgi:hypothetical protein
MRLKESKVDALVINDPHVDDGVVDVAVDEGSMD